MVRQEPIERSDLGRFKKREEREKNKKSVIGELLWDSTTLGLIAQIYPIKIIMAPK